MQFKRFKVAILATLGTCAFMVGMWIPSHMTPLPTLGLVLTNNNTTATTPGVASSEGATTRPIPPLSESSVELPSSSALPPTLSPLTAVIGPHTPMGQWEVLFEHRWKISEDMDPVDPWRRPCPNCTTQSGGDAPSTVSAKSGTSQSKYTEADPLDCGIAAARRAFHPGSEDPRFKGEISRVGVGSSTGGGVEEYTYAIKVSLHAAVHTHILTKGFDAIDNIGNAPGGSTTDPTDDKRLNADFRARTLLLGTLRLVTDSTSGTRGCLLSAEPRVVAEVVASDGASTSITAVWELMSVPPHCLLNTTPNAVSSILRLDLRWLGSVSLVPMWTWDQATHSTPEYLLMGMCHSLRSRTPNTCPHVFGLRVLHEAIVVPAPTAVTTAVVAGLVVPYWSRIRPKKAAISTFPNLIDAAQMNSLNGSFWGLRGVGPDTSSLLPFASSRQAMGLLMRRMRPISIYELCLTPSAGVGSDPTALNIRSIPPIHRTLLILGDSMMAEQFYALQQVLRPDLKISPVGRPTSFEVPATVLVHAESSKDGNLECDPATTFQLSNELYGFQFPSVENGKMFTIKKCKLSSGAAPAESLSERACVGTWSVKVILKVYFRRTYSTTGNELSILPDYKVLFVILKRSPDMILSNFAALHWMKNGRSVSDWRRHLKAVYEGIQRHNTDTSNVSTLRKLGTKTAWMAHPVPLHNLWLMGPTPRFTNPYLSMHQRRLMAFWAAQLEVFGRPSNLPSPNTGTSTFSSLNNHSNANAALTFGSALGYVLGPHPPFSPFAPRAVMPWGMSIGRQEATRDGQHLTCHQRHGGVAATAIHLWLHALGQ